MNRLTIGAILAACCLTASCGSDSDVQVGAGAGSDARATSTTTPGSTTTASAEADGGELCRVLAELGPEEELPDGVTLAQAAPVLRVSVEHFEQLAQAAPPELAADVATVRDIYRRLAAELDSAVAAHPDQPLSEWVDTTSLVAELTDATAPRVSMTNDLDGQVGDRTTTYPNALAAWLADPCGPKPLVVTEPTDGAAAADDGAPDDGAPADGDDSDFQSVVSEI